MCKDKGYKTASRTTISAVKCWLADFRREFPYEQVILSNAFPEDFKIVICWRVGVNGIIVGISNIMLIFLFDIVMVRIITSIPIVIVILIVLDI